MATFLSAVLCLFNNFLSLLGLSSPSHLFHSSFLLLFSITFFPPFSLLFPWVFLAFSFISLALLAFSLLIPSRSAWVRVTFVLHAMSTNKTDSIYSTILPTPILVVIKEFIKSGTKVEYRGQCMHQSKMKQNNLL